MSANILVAGIGNIFLGDDAFGVEVVRRLAARPLPAGVRVADFGIRGLDLAFELLDLGEGTAILVDATPRGGEPGTVYLIEAEPPDPSPAPEDSGWTDAHSMTPGVVLALSSRLGGTPQRVLVVGCEPLRADEEMGLSPPVERAVDEAVRMILEVIARETAS